MHKFSRTLLTLGVLAFGTLTAACGDKVEIVGPPVVADAVQSVTVSPSNASISAGTSIQLAANVIATGNAVRTVTWTSSNPAVASVNATGQVTAPANSAGGTVTIIATSTANPQAQGAAAIVVTATVITPIPPPSISINSVVDNFGNPVNLSNAAGQINVTVNVSNTLGGTGTIEVFLSSCASQAIGATEVPAATQSLTAGQSGQVTLSVNTAQLTTANAPRWANGNFCIKARVTASNGTAVATQTTPITLNNINVFRATLVWTNSPQKTGSPVTAVSSINGLNYNSGNLEVTLNPVIFTSPNQPVFISGHLSKNGETSGVACAPVCPIIQYTNIPVASGAAKITFTDTSAAIGSVRSIFGYNSLAAGDTLYVVSATDAAGNPITVAGGAFVAAGGVRIDNDIPYLQNNAVYAVPGSYVVTAPNGFIGAAYAFSSGTTAGTPAIVGGADVKAGVPGVGGVTTTYYVGAAGSAAFATANSCTVTGLTAATTANDLANTLAINADQAKVVVKDALGNSSCMDVASTYAGGLFGVDKIIPEASFVTTTVNGNAGASDVTGYNTTTRGFNLQFRDSISGFPQAIGSSPFVGTLKRDFYNTPSPATCVVGTYVVATTLCNPVAISTANVPSWFEAAQGAGSTFILGGFQMTNGTLVVGYYTAVLTASDVAGNSAATLTRTAAFDNVAPTVAAPTQAGAAVPLGSATISSGATDGLNLIASRGNLIYNLGTPIRFSRVTGNVLGTFGQFITSATATVTLPNVYRGMQDGSTGTISGVVVTPTASITVTDVGTNATQSAESPITTTTTAAAIQVGKTVSLASSAAAGTATASVATTNLTFQIAGLSTDVTFQSQPFAQVDVYKQNTGTGEWALVTSVTAATVTDNTTSGVRTFTWVASAVALSPGTGGGAAAAATNTFMVVARNAAGDAVRSPTVVQTNP